MLVLVSVALVTLAGPAGAQILDCTAPPSVPEDLTVSLVPARDGPTPEAPRLPAVLEIAWDAPAGGPENAPAIYVVEAGSGPAFAEIALVETGEAETRHAVPVANGTYYIRVRSRNDCGTSAASPEIEARVTGSVARGAPNPLVLLDTVNAVRERLGGTAFIRVMGQVRNGWLATSASFVEVTAIFDGPNGEASERASAYVNGRSRRLARSRLVTDTVLDAGGTGCFILFAEFPAFQITGVRFEVVADDRETEPLEGQVDVDGAVRQRADEFGDLMISGRMVNTGNRTTHFSEAWLDVRNTEGRVLDCDVAPVRGTNLVLDDGTTTRAALEPSAGGEFETSTETVFTPAYRLRYWINWDEAEEQEPAASTVRYRTLRARLAAMLDGDEQLSSPQERAALRDALRREIRSIEDQPAP